MNPQYDTYATCPKSFLKIVVSDNDDIYNNDYDE